MFQLQAVPTSDRFNHRLVPYHDFGFVSTPSFSLSRLRVDSGNFGLFQPQTVATSGRLNPRLVPLTTSSCFNPRQFQPRVGSTSGWFSLTLWVVSTPSWYPLTTSGCFNPRLVPFNDFGLIRGTSGCFNPRQFHPPVGSTPGWIPLTTSGCFNPRSLKPRAVSAPV